jgi:CDP-diacylglycerol--glycerol-3-phosphate 3-phosphatidyltransferase
MKKMNVPNKLTVLRICLVPIIVIISLINIPGEFLGIPVEYWLMDILFIIASITDKLDGDLARKNNQITNFGKFLDPIADKILVVSAFIILVGEQKLPTWVPIIVIFREFVVSAYRLITVQSNGKVIAANKWGKIKTASQMVAIIMAFIDKYPYGAIFTTQMSTFSFVWNLVVTVIMTFSVIATIFSGYEYLKGGKDLIFKDM